MTSGATAAVLVPAALVVAAGKQAQYAVRARHALVRLPSAGAPGEGRAMPRRPLRGRRGARDGEALADIVEALASTLATGIPVTDALDAAARTAPAHLAVALEEVAVSVRSGLPAGDALARWASSPASPDGAALVAAAFGIASTTGGDAVAGLAGVGATLRERQAVAREVHALASQARASATVIAVAPLGFALVTAGLGGTAARFLLGSPAGMACLVGGGVLDVVGWRWMRRITESVR